MYTLGPLSYGGLIVASLELVFSDLYNEVSRFLGTYGSSGPGTDDLADAKRIVNSAYRRFLNSNPNTWSFLKRYDRIITVSGTWEYELPNNFGNLLSNTFQYSSDTAYAPIEERSANQIIDMRAVSSYNQYAEYFAVRPGHYSKEAGQKWEAIFYPTFDSAYTLHYCYKILVEKLEGDNDIPIGGQDISECLKAICLAEAESYQDENLGVQEQKSKELLMQTIFNDNQKKAKTLGMNAPGRGLSPWDIHRGSYRINNVTYTTD